jgi:hypothetical protein
LSCAAACGAASPAEPSVLASGVIDSQPHDLVVFEGGNGLCMELRFPKPDPGSGFCPGRSEQKRDLPSDDGMDGPTPGLEAAVAYGLGPTAAATVQLRELSAGGKFVGEPVVYPVHALPGWVGHGTWWGPYLGPAAGVRLVEKFLDQAGHPVAVESFRG